MPSTTRRSTRSERTSPPASTDATKSAAETLAPPMSPREMSPARVLSRATSPNAKPASETPPTTPSPVAAGSLEHSPPPSPASATPMNSATTGPSSDSSTALLGLPGAAIEEALREIQKPEAPFWIGDSKMITENTEWAEKDGSTSMYLKWKANAPLRPEGSNDEVLVAWVGQVSLEGSTMGADGGWKTYFDETSAPRRKRTLQFVSPSHTSTSLPSVWEAQLKGAKSLVDNGRRTRTGKLANHTYCFLSEDMGNLKTRSPLFKKADDTGSGDVDNDSYDLDPSFLHHSYATWEFSSHAVRAVLDRVCEQGFIPQEYEAYDETDAHIHPNDIQKVLPGAIVCVFATLEKMKFTGPKQPGGLAWQFYANLEKLQVLKRRPTPTGSSSLKRKLDQIPTFGSKKRRED